MAAKPTISAIIIVKNEQKNIRECLESVVWVDEIIIIDSGSEDETLSICREYTERIFINTDWRGFGYQKSLALEKASQQWILSLDADERVIPELQAEIEQVIASDQDYAYAVPRQAYFIGKKMDHGGWWPDYVVRLFKKGSARFSDDIVHEHVLADAPIKKLQNPLIHYSYVSLAQLLNKINQYSDSGAEKMLARGKKSSLPLAILRGSWAFFKAYFLRLGLLDGQEGLITAIAKGEETYYKYLKLWYLNRS